MADFPMLVWTHVTSQSFQKKGGDWRDQKMQLVLRQCQPNCTHYLQLFKLSDFRYSLMLECWDSNPEGRPSFIKIGSSLSKPLMTMSGYCLVSDGARAQRVPQCCTEKGTLVRGSFGFATLASQLWFVPEHHCYVNLTQVYSCLAFLAFYAYFPANIVSKKSLEDLMVD